MLCAVLVASGCGDDGNNAVESVTTTIPSTTAAPITASSLSPTVAPLSTAAPSSTTVTATTAATSTTAAPPATVAASTPATSVAAVGTGRSLSEDEAVFAAVRRYFEVLVEANDPPDPASTLWDDVTTAGRADALRAKAQENLAALRGVRWPSDRQPLVRAPNTVLRQGSIAVVDACVRDNLVTYDLDTDAVIDDSVLYFWVQLTVTDHFGGLLVSQYRRVQEFESEGPCIAAYQ